MRLTPTTSPVKLHRWTFEEDKAYMEFISIAKTDPKYGKSSVKEWPAFSGKNSFWDDGANQHSPVMDSVTKTYPYMHNFIGHLHYNLTDTCRSDCFW